MLSGPIRLSIFAGVAALGAVGLTLALVGLGLPFLLAALVAAWAAGLAQYAALRNATPVAPAPSSATSSAPTPAPAAAPDAALMQQLDDYRRHTAALRHDLRGVLSPALMMSDRLLKHADPAVQRAGNAVVRSIDRATALLAESKELMTPEGTMVPAPNAATATTTVQAGPALPAR